MPAEIASGVLARKRGRRAEQAGLRMGNQLDRKRGHKAFEAPLFDEAFGKARAHEAVADTKAKAARDDDAACPLRQREIARYAAQRQAEAVDRRRRQDCPRRSAHWSRSPCRRAAGSRALRALPASRRYRRCPAPRRSARSTRAGAACAAARGSHPRCCRAARSRCVRLRSPGPDNRRRRARYAQRRGRYRGR